MRRELPLTRGEESVTLWLVTERAKVVDFLKLFLLLPAVCEHFRCLGAKTPAPNRPPEASLLQIITSLDLAKRTDILPGLRQVHWDLVVVDEVHRMSWTPPARKTARYALGELLGETADHILLLTATPHKRGSRADPPHRGFSD